MGKVRIAIVGVGNCASSLVQGLEYYKDADDGARVPGLMHVRFGPYHISDVEVVAAFDVDTKKVGADLAEAISASENNTIKIAEVAPTGVIVQRGPTLDGLGEYYREIITESDEPAVDVTQALRDSGADVLVSYLPVGSEEADRYYAQCAIDARVAFVNALPVFIASDPAWAAKFTEAGVPIIGDDIKSQVGATITHRVLAKLFEDRARPGYRRPGDLGQLLLHEVATGAVRRRRMPGPGRKVHCRRGHPITHPAAPLSRPPPLSWRGGQRVQVSGLGRLARGTGRA